MRNYVGESLVVSSEKHRGSVVPDPDNANAGLPNELQPIGNGRRRRKQAERGIKHPTKQQILLLKKAIRRITR